MSRESVEVVRALWAGFGQDPGEPWPPASRDELDRRLRLDLCDERIEIRNPAEFPAANEYHGHDGVRQWAAEVWEVFSEVHHELEEIIEADDGETVVRVQRTQGLMRHTQLPWDVLWAAVWTVRDGKAVRGQGYMTKEEALEAVGGVVVAPFGTASREWELSPGPSEVPAWTTRRRRRRASSDARLRQRMQ